MQHLLMMLSKSTYVFSLCIRFTLLVILYLLENKVNTAEIFNKASIPPDVFLDFSHHIMGH